MTIFAELARHMHRTREENISPEVAEAVKNAYADIKDAREAIRRMAECDERRVEARIRRD